MSPISKRTGFTGGLAIAVIVLAALFSLAAPASAQQLLNRFGWGLPYTVTNLGLGFGARPIAMGEAFMAVADGLSGVDYNPAGLASLRRPELMLGASLDTQTTHIPSFAYYQYDWDERYASTAYLYRLGNLAIDHAVSDVSEIRTGIDFS